MLSGLTNWLRRPVAWGAVLLSYVGIIAAVSYAAAVGATNADAIRAESHRADLVQAQQAKVSRTTIVKTGRIAIRNSCEFDNQRSRELVGILRAAQPPHPTPEQRRETQKFIAKVSFRDCKAAANVLTASPKETP